MVKAIPDGWLNYNNWGTIVPDTKFFPFKVPLKEMLYLKQQKNIRNGAGDTWDTTASTTTHTISAQTVIVPTGKEHTTRSFIACNPNVKLIINLTDTPSGRYYHFDDFTSKGIPVVSIRVRGGGKLPNQSLLNKFSAAVQHFMDTVAKTDPNALIGVHCTHGINRTGYFICNYMVRYMGIVPGVALGKYEKARGYKMDRPEFVASIIQGV